MNFLWINKYGNVFQYKVNILRIYLFEDKLKRNIKMNNWNRIFIDILDYKFTKEFIKESGICLKINIDLFWKCENYISCKDILEINNLENYLESGDVCISMIVQ